MTEPLFGVDGPGSAGTGAPALDGQYRLAQVQLMNWGTFQNLNTIEVSRKGQLITGESGSGKSSLLDGIATVLTPGRWLGYNSAAQDTGSRKGDRTLVSYLRGAWGKDEDAVEQRTVSRFLRSRALWGGVLLRFDTADGRTLTAARLFHLKGASTDPKDVRDLSVAVEEALTLEDLSEFISTGVDSRGAKRRWPGATVATGGAIRPYFNKLRRVLGIQDESGLQLLHRTQAAKNLGSLDRLFRDYMLDAPATFQLAQTAVEQFTDLRAAHRVVVRARQQLDALAHLDGAAYEFEAAEAEAAGLGRAHGSVDLYADQRLVELSRRDLAKLQEARAAADAREEQATLALKDAQEEARRADLQVDRDGGVAAAKAAHDSESARRTADQVQAEFDRQAAELKAVEVPMPDSAEALAQLQSAAREELAAKPQGKQLHETELVRDLHRGQATVTGLDQEILAARNEPRSKMPAQLLSARARIAQAVALKSFELPFAGELIDVGQDYAQWTGAIERVLAPLATTLLVQREHLPAVRTFINSHNMGVRLRFEEVDDRTAAPPRVGARSLVHRVTVVESAFGPWLQQRLSSRFDFACVDSERDLDQESKAVTLSGLMKNQDRSYLKDDRFRIDDRSRWLLGSSNMDRLGYLVEQRRSAQAVLESKQKQAGAKERENRLAERRRLRLESILNLPWYMVDVPAARAALKRAEAEQQLLASGNPDLQVALQRKQAADLTELRLGQEREQAQRHAISVQHEVAASQRDLDSALDRVGEQHVDPEVARDLDRRFAELSSGQRHVSISQLTSLARQVRGELESQIGRVKKRSMSASNTFTALASEFRARFTDAGQDRTTDVADREGYRELYRDVRERGLPNYERQFRELLEGRSVQLVGLLRSELVAAGREVRERIDPVNVSLERAPFDRERTLQIRVKEQQSTEVKTFISDMKQVTDGSWAGSVETDESRYAKLDSLMTRLGSSVPADDAWRKRCLDTREHVTFLAQELDQDGNVVNVYESSEGLSGGQRQRLVVFCLAAALRYQLAPDPDSPPQYGTVVLDEAFDKSDAKYTRIALEVFREFGFHMVLATPQKLLSVIEPYVGALSVVSNPTRAHSTFSAVEWTGVAGDAGAEPEDSA